MWQGTSGGPKPSLHVQHFYCSQSVAIRPSSNDEGVAMADGSCLPSFSGHGREELRPLPVSAHGHFKFLC